MQRVAILAGGGERQGEVQFGADAMAQFDSGFRRLIRLGFKPREHLRTRDRFLCGKCRDRDTGLLPRAKHQPVSRRQNRTEIDGIHHRISRGFRVRLESRALDLPAGSLDGLAVLVFREHHQFLRRGRGGKGHACGEGGVSRDIERFPLHLLAFAIRRQPVLRGWLCFAGELHDHRRQADALHAEGRTPGMPRIELKARRGGHGLALSGHAAGMLKELADVPGLQGFVVDLQLIEQPAQV